MPGSPNPRFPPYAVQPLHVLGATAYGGRLRRTRCSTGGLAVAAGILHEALGGPSQGGIGNARGRHADSTGVLGRPRGTSGKVPAQEARRTRAATRAKHYAHCSLRDMRAKSDTNRNIF